MLTLIQNSSKLVMILHIIIADATKKCFIFSTAILQGNPPTKNKLFQTYFSSSFPIRILILNLSARLALLNLQKESKQKSDHIAACSTLLNIGYGRITNFDLVILAFKYINSVKYFICSVHSI